MSCDKVLVRKPNALPSSVEGRVIHDKVRGWHGLGPEGGGGVPEPGLLQPGWVWVPQLRPWYMCADPNDIENPANWCWDDIPRCALPEFLCVVIEW